MQELLPYDFNVIGVLYHGS